ncbi:unnamed protein product, partial [Hapterophycus canaliculatus]
YRIFTHFYTFIGFSDPVAARHHRRLVRDLVHFRESLFCAAAAIVGRLRTAGGGSPGRWSGYYGDAGFSTFHIRRGDFQYTKVRVRARAGVSLVRRWWAFALTWV